MDTAPTQNQKKVFHILLCFSFHLLLLFFTFFSPLFPACIFLCNIVSSFFLLLLETSFLQTAFFTFSTRNNIPASNSRRQSALSKILSLKLIHSKSNVPRYKLFLNKYSSLLIATGRKNKLSARIIPVFAETEPTAFPIAMTECPSNAAATETMISGIVVAKLTIVAPITYFGIPSISDNFDAASTNQSPPLQIKISPIKKDI